MINLNLYKKEILNLKVILLIFMAILTLYTSIICSMYSEEFINTLKEFDSTMGQVMNMVGMGGAITNLNDYLATYLYGFIYLVFPTIFSIICGNKLICKYVEKTSMVHFLAAPVSRFTFVLTQIKVMVSGILILILYITFLELTICQLVSAGELDVKALLMLNFGLLCLHLFIASICFLASVIFNEGRKSLFVGSGIPLLGIIIKMLSEASPDAEDYKYFTFFTFFRPAELIEYTSSSIFGIFVLLFFAIVFFVISIIIFLRKDLHI